MSRGFLFLEDVGTKPYQWDRMLLHLRYAGMLEHVTRDCLRRYAAVRAPEEMRCWRQAILHALRIFPGPIAIGLRSGHVDAPNITLPLGVRGAVGFEAMRRTALEFLEAAVR
jgi:muramoyltetrapeptide carboxypeptidase